MKVCSHCKKRKREDSFYSYRNSWKNCTSSISIPSVESIIKQKRRYINRKRYSGKGRPKKTDYDYKSILDIIFETGEIYNKITDNMVLST